MEREDDKALWELLGRSVERDISPFFARNVVRRLRRSDPWLERVRSQFTVRKMAPVAGFAAAVAAVVLLMPAEPPPERLEDDRDLIAQIDPQDYEVVAELDDLLGADENSLWTDSSSL